MYGKRVRGIATYQPPKGYGVAKAKLQTQWHEFERARTDFGFEEGTFLDGAYVSTRQVIELADLSASERKARLEALRRETKPDACGAVESYMAGYPPAGAPAGLRRFLQQC